MVGLQRDESECERGDRTGAVCIAAKLSEPVQSIDSNQILGVDIGKDDAGSLQLSGGEGVLTF